MNWCYIGNVHLKEVLLLEIWWLLMANIMSLVLTVEALNFFYLMKKKIQRAGFQCASCKISLSMVKLLNHSNNFSFLDSLMMV